MSQVGEGNESYSAIAKFLAALAVGDAGALTQEQALNAKSQSQQPAIVEGGLQIQFSRGLNASRLEVLRKIGSSCMTCPLGQRPVIQFINQDTGGTPVLMPADTKAGAHSKSLAGYRFASPLPGIRSKPAFQAFSCW